MIITPPEQVPFLGLQPVGPGEVRYAGVEPVPGHGGAQLRVGREHVHGEALVVAQSCQQR